MHLTASRGVYDLLTLVSYNKITLISDKEFSYE
jgi:hypothetical protein